MNAEEYLEREEKRVTRLYAKRGLTVLGRVEPNGEKPAVNAKMSCPECVACGATSAEDDWAPVLGANFHDECKEDGERLWWIT